MINMFKLVNVVCYVVSMVTVVLSVILGMLSVWVDGIPVEKGLITLGILFAGSVICAIVSFVFGEKKDV